MSNNVYPSNWFRPPPEIRHDWQAEFATGYFLRCPKCGNCDQWSVHGHVWHWESCDGIDRVHLARALAEEKDQRYRKLIAMGARFGERRSIIFPSYAVFVQAKHAGLLEGDEFVVWGPGPVGSLTPFRVLNGGWL